MKPRFDAVLLLSICFLLAPFGNMAISFHMMNIPGWYNPGTFFSLFRSLSNLDFALSASIVVTGFLLLFRRKIAWTMAIATLLFSLALNLFLIFQNMNVQGRMIPQALASAISSLSIGFLIFRFRYPYLDRRDNWSTVHRRHKVRIPCEATIPFAMSMIIGNISKSGAFLNVEESQLARLSIGNLVKLQIEADFLLEGNIIHKKADGFAIRFLNLSSQQKVQISQLIKRVGA